MQLLTHVEIHIVMHQALSRHCKTDFNSLDSLHNRDNHSCSSSRPAVPGNICKE